MEKRNLNTNVFYTSKTKFYSVFLMRKTNIYVGKNYNQYIVYDDFGHHVVYPKEGGKRDAVSFFKNKYGYRYVRGVKLHDET